MSRYRGSRRGMAGMGLVAFIAFSVASSTQSSDPFVTRAWTIAIGGAVLVFSCGVIAWLHSIRLELAPEGLSFRSMFGRRELLWLEVERVYIDSVTYSFHGVPLSHRLVTIVTQDGRKLSIGKSIERTEQMMHEVATLTLPELYARMVAALNTGLTVDLGAVRLSRMNGLEMKGLFGFGAIGLDEIERYEVEAGELLVWKKGARFASRVRSASVANLYPLLAVLDSLLKAPVTRGAAPYAGSLGPARRY